jgi:hypothetical protein
MLTGNTLAAYNNLASFPPSPKLGDLLNAVNVPNPAYVGLVTPVEIDIYVAATGDDATGDGSSQAPYRSVDRAFADFINAQLPATSVVNVYCGAGDFEMPQLGAFIPTNILVSVYGDLSNPLYEGPADTSSDVAGYFALREVAIGAYADTVTDASHWLLCRFNEDYPADYSDAAFPCATSTSPNIQFVAGYDATSFSRFGVYPYATRFVAQNTAYRGNTAGSASLSNIDPSYGATGLRVFGVKYTTAQAYLRLSDAALQACVFDDDGATTVVTVSNSVVGGAFVGSWVEVINSMLSCAITDAYVVDLRDVFASDVVEKSDGGVWTTACSVDLYRVDFRTASAVAINPTRPSDVFIRRCSIVGHSLIDTTASPGCTVQASVAVANQIAGSVTGPFAVRLRNGAQGLNLEAACNGNLSNTTTPGADIVVGQNAVATWASLPANDHSPSSSSQWCRAS